MAANLATNIRITARDDTGRAFSSLKNRIGEVEGAFGRLKGMISGLGVAISSVAFGRMMADAINAADSIGKLSQKTGIATDMLTAYTLAADLSESSIDGVAKGMQRLARNMLDYTHGIGEARDIFDELGISVVDAAGKLRSTDAVFKELATKFAAMEDGARKSAIAQMLLGRAGTELIPMLNEGGKKLGEYTDQARALGLVISEETIVASTEFNDNLTIVRQSLTGISNDIARDLMPTLANLTGMLRDNALEADHAAGKYSFLDDALKFAAFFAFKAKEEFKDLFDWIGYVAALLDTKIGPGFFARIEAINAAREETRRAMEDRVTEFVRRLNEAPRTLADAASAQDVLNSSLNDGAKATAAAEIEEKKRRASILQIIEALEWKDHVLASVGESEEILRLKALGASDGEIKLARSFIASTKAAEDLIDANKELTSDKETLRTMRLKNDLLEEGIESQAMLNLMILEQEKSEAIAAGATREYIDVLQRRIEITRQILEEEERASLINTTRQAAEEAERAWTDAMSSIEDTITDALMRGFESGKDIVRNVIDTIQNMFATTVLRPVVQASVTGIMGATGLMSAGPAGASGGLSSALPMAGSILGSTTLGTGVMAGANLMAAGQFGAYFSSMFGGLTSGTMAGTMAGIGMALPVLLPLALLAGAFSKKPSHKTQWGTVDMSTGETFDIGGLTGKKFSQENADIRDLLLQAVGDMAAQLMELSGRAFEDVIRIGVSSRTGIFAGFGYQNDPNRVDIGLGKDAGRAIVKILEMMVERGFEEGDATGETIKAWAQNITGTAEEALADVQGLFSLLKMPKDIEQSIKALHDPAVELTAQLEAMDAAFEKAADAARQAAESGDLSTAYQAASELYRLTVERYQTEITMARRLQDAVISLKTEAAQFVASLTQKMGVSGGAGAIKAAGFAQLDVFMAETDPARRLEVLKDIVTSIDNWLAAAQREINDNYNKQIDALQEQRALIIENTSKQTEALQTQLELAQQWVSVLDTVQAQIERMRLSSANPLSLSGRLGLAGESIEALRAQLEGATGQERIDISRKLMAAYQEQLRLSQEMYDRPSPEYQSIYNDIISGLSEIEAEAKAEAEKAAELQRSIEALNQVQADALASIDAQIASLDSQRNAALAAIQKEANSYYAQALSAGENLYALLEAQAQSQLDALLGGLSYDEFIARKEQEIVDILTQIRDGVSQFLGNPPNIDGSHANGLDYVPRDGYIAKLHKGERVLTASEARQSRSVTVNINVAGSGNAADIKRAIIEMVPVIKRELRNA